MAEKEFLQELQEYVFYTYPQDIHIKRWFQKYSEKFGHNKQVLKRSGVKQEVKNKLLESYSEDRRISGEVKIELETIDSCVKSIQHLELTIKSNKRDIIYNSALQGQVFSHLKTIKKEIQVSF